MRTFDLTLSIDVRAVVPQEFTDNMRDAAKDEFATEFLRNAHAMFPTDDEGFTLHILKHGTRRCIREELLRFYEGSGLGGTFSPVSAVVQDRRAEPPTTPAVLASQVAEVIPH